MTDQTAIEFSLDLAKHVAGRVSGLVLDKNVFAGQERSALRGVFFFTDIGGLEPEGYCGELRVKKHGRVQIRHRGDPKRYKDSLAKMRDVWGATHYAPISGYFEVRCVESDPNFLGEDDDGNPVWTLNVDMWREVTVATT